MPPRQLLLAAGLAGVFVVSDRTDAQPAPQLAMTMASSGSCDGLRDLMLDTVVHQTIVGGSYAPKHYHRHRQGRPGAEVVNKRKKKAAPSRSRSYDTFDDAGGSFDGPAPAPTAAPPAAYSEGRSYSEVPAQSGPSHYTKTNIQEKGVDEADIIKTDGKYVYTVRANELVIAKTWPVDKTEITARVAFNTVVPQQVYLHGNEVIVQGQTYEQLTGWNLARTRVLVIDVSKREQPAIKRIIDVDGQTVSSRLVRDDLFLVQTQALPIPPKLVAAAAKAVPQLPAQAQSLRPWEQQARRASALRAQLANQLATADLEAAMPRVRNGFVTKQMTCADLFLPSDNIQTQVTTLAKVSVVDSDADLVGAVVAGGQVYASRTNLYVTAPSYTTNANGAAEYGTQVHQFSLGGETARPAYVASGRVEGTLLNQFSMSEWKGDLRIATTDAGMVGNNLFVMRPFGKTLAVIGTLRGMGKGERIYAGRMAGDEGYLVTFRQTDPLYTLDLKDPTRPRVSGELKVNGFSSYIHPLGDGLLLTIGQDADDNGRQLGAHVQVFDVKDPTKPTRKFHERLGAGTYSTAQNDHKAFMWDPITKTFAVPVAQSTANEYWNGLAVFSLDKDAGFRSKGRIDHGALTAAWVDEQCAAQKKASPKLPVASLTYCNAQYKKRLRGQYPVMRSLVIDQYIVSLSSLGLEVHALADLDERASLSWTEKKVALAR